MLFNSIGYLFAFLPAVVLLVRLAGRFASPCVVRAILVAATLVFYAMGGPRLLPLLLASTAANCAAGQLIARTADRPRVQSLVVGAGVIGNLLFLGWFKYANFAIASWAALAGTPAHLLEIALPLGISFYTFQQIGYLVDMRRGRAASEDPLSYASFVLFFPQLLAGPIVQHRELAPQLAARPTRPVGSDVVVGLTILAIGLFKKTVVADTAALYAAPGFVAAGAPGPIGMLDAWLTALAYTVQVYFDFSGYSDMAIGSARMLGIVLPLNFHSPLRAGSVVEIWRRWHITLGRWVQSYIFQPVAIPMARLAATAGAGKWGTLLLSVVVPTMLTMLVVGVWHGAGWTFVLFGLMQGVAMSVNEAWALYRKKARRTRKGVHPGWHRPVAVAATLLTFNLSIVPFGSPDLATAGRLFAAMAGASGWLAVPAAWPLGATGAGLCVAALYLAVFLVPNTQQIMARFEPVLEASKWVDPAAGGRAVWMPTLGWAVFTGAVLFLGVAFISRGAVKFVYFNF